MKRPHRPTITALSATLAIALTAPAAAASSGGAVAPGTPTTPTITTTPTTPTAPGTTTATNAHGGKHKHTTTNVATNSTGGVSAGTPGSARRSSRVKAPVLTSATRYGVGKTHCHRSNRRIVQITGELVIHGHRFSGAMTVYFPASGVTAARVDPIAAPLRPTPHGFAVTVPAGAASGRIYLENGAGVRSNSYGPLKIAAAPYTAVVAPLPTAPNAFDGAGRRIWYVSQSDGGNLAAIAAQAQGRRDHDAVHQVEGTVPSDSGRSSRRRLISVRSTPPASTSAPGSTSTAQNPAGEAARGAQAVAAGADCLVIDAESDLRGAHWGGADLHERPARRRSGPPTRSGSTSFPYVNLHETDSPTRSSSARGAPSTTCRRSTGRTSAPRRMPPTRRTYIENRVYQRPIVPIGQAYDNVPASQITRFRQLASDYGAIGFSFYSWQAASSGDWGALEQPFTPGATIALPTSWPALQEGNNGDQVLWMQEHLAAAEPTTPTSGDFDAATEAALLAFQRAHSLPASGITDSATWADLLALAPVVVQFPEPSGSTGPTGTTGSSGTTGTTGTSGSSGGSGSSGASGSGGTTA